MANDITKVEKEQTPNTTVTSSSDDSKEESIGSDSCRAEKTDFNSIYLDGEENDEEFNLKKSREFQKEKSLEFRKSYQAPMKKKSCQDDNYDDDDFDLDKYPVREWNIQLPFLKSPIVFNPIVSGIGVLVLWGLSIWCMVDNEGSLNTLVAWKSVITLDFTWLFIGTRCVYFFFLLIIVYRFGNIKLGHPNEEPEFTTGSYFMMIFAAGVAIGLFVYGFAEPIMHRDGSNFYTNQDFRSQDEKDMFALNMTILNWGLTAWSPYLIVAVSMGLAGHRYNLPMTFRSCFYPIFGDYTWGWIGDIIDGVTIVTTVAGVCTSLGIGAMNIVAGFQFLGWVNDDVDQDRLTFVQNLTIWGVTALSTASVLAGLHAGIQSLSKIAFCFGMLLNFLVFVMDDTKYLLNLAIQEVGYYLQGSILQLNFWTDAFGQLRDGEGRATDGQAAADWWMDAWMIFYQAWWISWAAFVGLFIARISKGRTIKEVIVYSLITPAFYCIYWFSVFGGIGLRQVRQAEELEYLGATHFNDSSTFLVPGSDFCYDVPQESVYIQTMNADTGKEENVLIFQNYLPGVTPVCQYESFNKASYNILHSFSYPDSFENGAGLGRVLSIIFIIALAIYFATSSDSGSLIVDHLASNGRHNHHWIQRLFWAVTEGAVATALLTAGGASALTALQTVSVISGLPFVILLTYLIESIWVMCKQAESSPDSTEFVSPSLSSSTSEFAFPIFGGVFNVFEYCFSFGQVNRHRIIRNMDLPSSLQTIEFAKGIFFPFASLYQVLSVTYPTNSKQNLITVLSYTFFYVGWITIFTFTLVTDKHGLRGFGWSFFFIAGILLAYLRNGFRVRYNLRSNVFGDLTSSLFIWPQVMAQLRIQCIEFGLPSDDGVDDSINEDEKIVLSPQV